MRRSTQRTPSNPPNLAWTDRQRMVGHREFLAADGWWIRADNNRIEAFTDGVFAIIVTLLVLELKVPALKDHGSVTELTHHLLELLPKFLSWLNSFIIACKFWLNHHHILGLARHADYGMVWLNSIFLMFQSFIPFPTAMMGNTPPTHWP